MFLENPEKYLYYLPERLVLEFSSGEDGNLAFFFPAKISISLRPVVRDREGLLRFLREGLERLSSRAHVPLGKAREPLVSRLYGHLEKHLRSQTRGRGKALGPFFHSSVVGEHDSFSAPRVPLEEVEGLFGPQSPLLRAAEESLDRKHGDSRHKQKFKDALEAQLGEKVRVRSVEDLLLNRVLIGLCRVGYRVQGKLRHESDFPAIPRFYPEMARHLRLALAGYTRDVAKRNSWSFHEGSVGFTNLQLAARVEVSGDEAWARLKEESESLPHPLLPLLQEEPFAHLEPQQHQWRAQLNLFSYHQVREAYLTEVLLPWIEASGERLGVRLEAEVRKPRGSKYACPLVEGYTLSLLFPEEGLEGLEVFPHGLFLGLVVSEEVRLSGWEGGAGTPKVSLSSQSLLALVPPEHAEPLSKKGSSDATTLSFSLGSKNLWSKEANFSVKLPREEVVVPSFYSDLNEVPGSRKGYKEALVPLSLLLLARTLLELREYRFSRDEELENLLRSIRFLGESLCLDGRPFSFFLEAWRRHAPEFSEKIPEHRLFLLRPLVSHFLRKKGGTLSEYFKGVLSEPRVASILRSSLLPNLNGKTFDGLAEGASRIVSGLLRGIEGFLLLLPGEEGLSRRLDRFSLKERGISEPSRGPELTLTVWGYDLCWTVDHARDICSADKLELRINFDL